MYVRDYLLIQIASLSKLIALLLKMKLDNNTDKVYEQISEVYSTLKIEREELIINPAIVPELIPYNEELYDVLIPFFIEDALLEENLTKKEKLLTIALSMTEMVEQNTRTFSMERPRTKEKIYQLLQQIQFS